MARSPRSGAPRATLASAVLDDAHASLLDLVDNLLNQGVLLTGDVVLGLADVDLVYLRLSALLCAADRVLPPPPAKATAPRPARRPAPHAGRPPAAERAPRRAPPPRAVRRARRAC